MNKKKINLNQILKEFAEKLPKFPDGRIDYSNSDKAPVLNCFVKFQDKILLLKRSNKVRVYRGKWNSVGGYLDEFKPIRKKILEELKEELGILEKNIDKIKVGTPYEFFDSDINKTWLIYPSLVELKQKPKIKLDWEHTKYKWINPRDITEYNIVSRLDESLKKVWIF